MSLPRLYGFQILWPISSKNVKRVCSCVLPPKWTCATLIPSLSGLILCAVSVIPNLVTQMTWVLPSLKDPKPPYMSSLPPAGRNSGTSLQIITKLVASPSSNTYSLWFLISSQNVGPDLWSFLSNSEIVWKEIHVLFLDLLRLSNLLRNKFTRICLFKGFGRGRMICAAALSSQTRACPTQHIP
jgi:hypothetical protein